MRTNISGTVHNVTRIKNSVNGNPRFSINIGGVSYRTDSDAGFNYDIENMIGRGLIDSEVVAVINGRDNIVEIHMQEVN
jgi:hypothetical protein